MEKKVRELGIPILFKHKMTKVYRDGDGPVAGVEVQTDSGTINIKARKAVILCTGTWTDNERMAGLYDPRIVGPDTYGDGGTPCDGTLFVDSSGDGHVAAAEVGAAFTDMSFVAYLYIFFGSRSYWGWEPADFTNGRYVQGGKGVSRTRDFYQNIVLVKQDGQRYIDESLGAQSALSWEENRKLPIPQSGSLSENIEWPFTQKYLSLPQPRNVWAVADSAIAAALRWPMDTLRNPNPKHGLMLDPACIAIADTLDDLARQMKIDAAALRQTLNRYNGFADSGVDADFGKKAPMRRIATAPFYGLKASLIRHTQRNGARVNTKSQVIAALQPGDGVVPLASINDEKVIPHLYAAGELGNIMGYRRPHGSLGNYAIFARIAGENAAKETPID
jgi:succinate dehydrogenase/fumarate reductase flavoprotein subunit